MDSFLVLVRLISGSGFFPDGSVLWSIFHSVGYSMLAQPSQQGWHNSPQLPSRVERTGLDRRFRMVAGLSGSRSDKHDNSSRKPGLIRVFDFCVANDRGCWRHLPIFRTFFRSSSVAILSASPYLFHRAVSETVSLAEPSSLGYGKHTF